jgi:hypothetical protein
VSKKNKQTSEPAPENIVAGDLALICEADAITIEAADALDSANAEGETRVPRFKMTAYTGDAMIISGWKHPVVVDLDGLAIPSQRRPVRFAHSAYQGVGHSERIAVENNQLIAEGVVSRDTPAAREIVASGKRGFPWQASIGAAVREAELIRAQRSVTVNGRTFEGPVYIARKTTLGEISFVDLGADTATSASIAAQRQKDPAMPTPNASESPEAKDVVSESASLETPESEPATTEPTGKATTPAKDGDTPVAVTAAATKQASVTPDIEAARKQAADELRRQSKIREICGGSGGKHTEIAAKAIEEGWSTEKAELEVLRASRPVIGGAPALHVPDNAMDENVLEAACMMTSKLKSVEDLYEDKTLEAASKKFRGGIGLQELLLEAAWANGYTGRNFRNSREVLRFAFGYDIHASGGGLSTIDISGILSNVANKFLLEGFFSVERTWRAITAIRNVSDFKTVTSYRLIGKDQYEQVAPGGELKHGTLGEESYANKADTYGLLLSIDRRDVINDDLGAITTVPRKLGRGSGLKINDVFWATFLDNATFFTAGNANLLTGADTALSHDAMSKAVQAFDDLKDAEGKPLAVMPSILLVPTALNATAQALYRSQEIRNPGASAKYPITNLYTNQFPPQVSRYLSSSQYTGNSDKAWYLLADPADLPVIETAFLNGQESPTIETAEADFNVLGIQMRGYHDFGVAKQEPKGGVRMKGEA